jgi:CBS-domain-containing membrane protein
MILSGTVCKVDVANRALRLAIHGREMDVDVPVGCPIFLRSERVKLRLLQPQDNVDVICETTGQGPTARKVVVKNATLAKEDNPMKATLRQPRLHLRARTAVDVMTSRPVSLFAGATIREAVAFLTDKGISAAPVIDEAGRPVGVISRADLVRYDRERLDYAPAKAPHFDPDEYFDKVPPGFQVERPDATQVKDVMTPVVFSVVPSTSITNVVEEMLARRVHRLFVIDDGGVLVGVISTLDVLRKLAGADD